MDEQAAAFITENPSAAMITLRPDGTPHSARIGVAIVDGRIQSSGTQTRVRTKHLRRDPRANLFVFETSPPAAKWLGLEAEVTILDGPDSPELNYRLMRTMQKERNPDGKVAWFNGVLTEEEFLQTMRDEQRLVYEFHPTRVYGYY